jgi:hypothetical protein
MGRGRLVAVLHEEAWNRPDDLGHSNLNAPGDNARWLVHCRGRVKTGDRAAF